MNGHGKAEVVGKAFFLGALTTAIASVEMSSKFSVMNFSKDQVTLQRAADALRGYIFIAVVWTLATMLVLYGSDGWFGAWMGLIANVVIMAWIIGSYLCAFRAAAKAYNLQVPCVFGPSTIQ